MPGECLDRLLLVSRQHAERVLHAYVFHYNQQRPHRGSTEGHQNVGLDRHFGALQCWSD
ncbi:MAG: integrase core domain-containing protein [Acidimicrobiales bacterium]